MPPPHLLAKTTCHLIGKQRSLFAHVRYLNACAGMIFLASLGALYVMKLQFLHFLALSDAFYVVKLQFAHTPPFPQQSLSIATTLGNDATQTTYV